MKNNNNTKNIPDNKIDNVNYNDRELILIGTYTNADIDKLRIYKENKRKCGVYC